MKSRFLFVFFSLFYLCVHANCETFEEINEIRNSILKNLDQYECLEFTSDETLNEDAHRYDTARFYRNAKGDLVYINWQRRGHYYHIMGDVVNYSELFLLENNIVYYRNWGYSFENSQWHLEEDLDQTKIHVTESLIEYYMKDGSALREYKGREVGGEYKNRFTLLDSVPLEEKLQRRWSDRCDKCIEEDYLSIYRKLLTEKSNK